MNRKVMVNAPVAAAVAAGAARTEKILSATIVPGCPYDLAPDETVVNPGGGEADA